MSDQLPDSTGYGTDGATTRRARLTWILGNSAMWFKHF